MENNQKTLGMLPLVLFSVGCTLASGVFALSGDFAYAGAYTLGTLIGWGITFVGMLGLVGCFLRLTIVKPELTSGIYSYARAGFGEYIGFNSAWGYWLSAILAKKLNRRILREHKSLFTNPLLDLLGGNLIFFRDHFQARSRIVFYVLFYLLEIFLNGLLTRVTYRLTCDVVKHLSASCTIP